MSTLTIYPKTKEEEKLYLQMAKALNNKVERKIGKPYKPELVKKVIKGKLEINKGKGIKIDIADLWK